MTWPMVKLGEISNIIMGQAPTGDSYNQEGNGYPLIAGAGEFGERYPSTIRYTEKPSKISNIDDILICVRATIGDINWADSRYCLGRGVAAIRANHKFIDNKYLWNYVFYSKEYLKSLGRGAIFKQINRSDLENLEIPLPPLDEQRRIAAILDQADALRRQRRVAIAEIKALIVSMFFDLFSDPVLNAKSWPVYKLGDVGVLDRGISKHRPRNDPTLLGGDYPLVQTGDIAQSEGYIQNYSATYSEKGLRQSKLWPAGTLCITIAANIGKTGILTFEACFPDSVVGFSPTHLVTTEYVQHWMGAIQKKLEDDAPQSAQKNINLAILRALDIPVPPKNMQVKFSNIVAALNQQKQVALIHLAHLDTLFASLQQRAFRGEL